MLHKKVDVKEIIVHGLGWCAEAQRGHGSIHFLMCVCMSLSWHRRGNVVRVLMKDHKIKHSNNMLWV